MSRSAERPNPGFLRSRWFRAAAVVALVLVLGIGARRFLLGGPKKDAEPAKVHREDLVMTVDVTGELAAVRATMIGPPQVKDIWDFKISFLVPESTQVKKGQPIIGFDTQSLEKGLEEKRAEFAEAAKQIERKEIDLGMQVRAQELALSEAEAKRGKARLKADVPSDLTGSIDALAARLDLDDAEKEVANLQARLEATKTMGAAELRALGSRRDRAKGRVEDLEAAIEAMRVKAPQDGIVVYKTGWRDDKKKVGDSTWAGEKVLELPDLSEMMARGEVDEADAGQVGVGQKVTIRLEAHPDVDFKGRVRTIGRTVRRQSWRVPTKVYKLEVALEKTDAVAMRPAMRFRGEIETGRIPSLLVAPREAVFLRSSGPVVWIQRGQRYEETPVQLGRHNKQLVEILAGAVQGDSIATTDLRPPEPVRARGPMAAGL